MRKYIIASSIILLASLCYGQDFMGKVILNNGKKITGKIWVERGRLFIHDGIDTLQFKRPEIKKILRESPKQNQFFRPDMNIFAGELSGMPNLLIGGIAGANFKINKKLNVGGFFHYGENDYTNHGKSNMVFVRTYGVNYDFISKNMILLIGKTNNFKDNSRYARGNLFGIILYSDHLFIQIGYLSRPDCITGGMGFIL